MGPARARPLRRVPVVLCAALLLSGCSGWGFVEELAAPEPPAPGSGEPPPAPPLPEPRVVADTVLLDDRRAAGGPFRAELTLTVHPVATGVPPLPQSFAGDCGLADPAAVRYLAVDIGYRNLADAVAAVAADIEVRTAPGAPDRTGEVALFLESADGGVRYCQDGDRTPVSDHFAVDAGGAGEREFRAYVVAPVADAAGGDPLAGLVLALGGFENPAYFPPDLSVPGRYAVVVSRVGGPCPGDADSVCAVLG